MLIDILNLSPGFDPKSQNVHNEILKFKKFDFLGGEPHIQILPTGGCVRDRILYITHRINSVSDFFDIILANDAARRMGYQNIQLIIPYFPAARQDRVCNVGEPLTVKVFADLINQCKFDNVVILGPHSEVTTALLDNVEVVDNDEYYAVRAFEIIKKMYDSNNQHVLNVVCPDAGAGKRVGKIAKLLQDKVGNWARVNLIRCEKVRDVATGELKEFFVAADDLENAPTIIFDDIVAKGGTFLGLADILRQKNCGPLGIFTYHADCQEGLNNLESKFDLVLTTNSKRDYPETEKVKLIPFVY